MNDDIANLKKTVVAIQKQIKDKQIAKETIEKTIESFLWANGIVGNFELDYIDDSFPSCE
jgi:hypothetical protein